MGTEVWTRQSAHSRVVLAIITLYLGQILKRQTLIPPPASRCLAWFAEMYLLRGTPLLQFLSIWTRRVTSSRHVVAASYPVEAVRWFAMACRKGAKLGSGRMVLLAIPESQAVVGVPTSRTLYAILSKICSCPVSTTLWHPVLHSRKWRTEVGSR